MPLFCGEVQKHARYGRTIIIHGNVGGEKLIGPGLKRFGIAIGTRKVANQDIRTLLITIPKKEQTKLTVRQVTMDDVDRIVAMPQEDFSKRLFGPIVDRDTFVRDRELRPNFGIDSYYVQRAAKSPELWWADTGKLATCNTGTQELEQGTAAFT
ncbi:MAG: hypothetical protein MUF54_13855, partial [Polyangiaceae bacterium]|nr:hypothetical protein [Polyangiaceae bacterium]